MTRNRFKDDAERLVGARDDDAVTLGEGRARLAAELSAAVAPGWPPQGGKSIDPASSVAAYLDGALTGRERDAYLAMLAASEVDRLDAESAAALITLVGDAEPPALPAGLTARAAVLLGPRHAPRRPVAAARPWWRRRYVVASALTGIAALLCVPALVALREDSKLTPVDNAVPAAPPVAAPMAKRSEQFRAGEPERWLRTRNSLGRKAADTGFRATEDAAVDCDPIAGHEAEQMASARDVQIVPRTGAPAESDPIKKDCRDTGIDQTDSPAAVGAPVPEPAARQPAARTAPSEPTR